MADKKTPRRVKKPETVRERAQRQEAPKKPRRISKVTGTAKKPWSKLRQAASKEYHPITLPDSKIGRLLKKRVRFMPKFFGEAWQEVRQVTWPNAGETTKLTIAVLLFALVLGGLVWAVDYGLNKLFEEILVG